MVNLYLDTLKKLLNAYSVTRDVIISSIGLLK